MKTKLVLVGSAEDVAECVAIGDTIWIYNDESRVVGGPLTVMVCEGAEEPDDASPA